MPRRFTRANLIAAIEHDATRLLKDGLVEYVTVAGKQHLVLTTEGREFLAADDDDDDFRCADLHCGGMLTYRQGHLFCGKCGTEWLI